MHRCGDIFWAQLDEDMHGGSLQTGFRPVLIVSNDKANQYSPVVTIVPITSKIGKKRLPTHVFINGCGLRQRSRADHIAKQIPFKRVCREYSENNC